ncbi:sigma-70 factor domain-containing protein, partial [Prochlorococcus marinus]|uniref:sigma-70 factor domain-containing protein n=1 Tax=Prochlorococcus marinus TaxID=1219 RepID=UPI002E25E210
MSPASKSLDKSAVESARQLPADVDLVRSYLRDIGRVPLLSHEQEITLGRQVQELMSLEQLES